LYHKNFIDLESTKTDVKTFSQMMQSESSSLLSSSFSNPLIQRERDPTEITIRYNELKSKYLSEDNLIEKYSLKNKASSSDRAPWVGIVSNDFIKDVVANKLYTLRVESVQNDSKKVSVSTIDCRLAEAGGVDFNSPTTTTGDRVYYPDHDYVYSLNVPLHAYGSLVYNIKYLDKAGVRHKVYAKRDYEFFPIDENDALLVAGLDACIDTYDESNYEKFKDGVDNDSMEVCVSPVQLFIKESTGAYTPAVGATYKCIGMTGRMLYNLCKLCTFM
ncbi:hypothetical protein YASMINEVIRUS_636, partial [Yasminevirus sp. GU-2018]